MMRTFLVATYLQEEIPNFVIIKNLSETPNEKNKKKKEKWKKLANNIIFKISKNWIILICINLKMLIACLTLLEIILLRS